MKLPVMTLTQAKQLAGKRIHVGGKSFVFDSDIKAGGQAIAIPLKDNAGNRIAFFRSLFAMAMTPPKIERMSWMIGQRLHLLSEAFMGSPQLWVNTESQGRPEGVDFDFAGAIHGIALGTSWKSWKEDIEMGLRNEPSTSLRLQFARGLLQRLACLEVVGNAGFVHGDISDANVMLDDNSGKVNLIDFDCFIFESPSLQRSKLMIRDGGSKGTPGYIPESFCNETSIDQAPLGDRFARDILLIELLGFREGDPIDLSPLYWTEQDELLDDIKPSALSLKLDHLQSMQVFERSESERPSSFELANKLGLPIENNVSQTLSLPPVLPYDVAADVPVQSKSNASPTTKSTPSFQFPKISSTDDLVSLIGRQADRGVIALGKQILPLMKLGIAGVIGIFATALWVILLIYLLKNLSLPANLVACGILIYYTVTSIKRNRDWLEQFLAPK